MWTKFLRTLLLGVLMMSVLSGPALRGSEIPRYTLEQAREYALKHNITVMNAGLDIQAARKKIWETTATGLPKIDAAISYQNMIKIPVTLVPAKMFDEDAKDDEFLKLQFGTQHNVSADFTVSQLVFSGSYIVALQASRVYLKISENSLRKSEIDIKATVADTYYLILMAEDTLKTMEVSLGIMRQNLEETREMVKAGFVEDTDADQLQLAVTDLENAVNTSRRQVEISYRLLKFQMGLDLEKEIALEDSLEVILSGINATEMIQEPFLVEKHVDFGILDNQVKSQKLLLRREYMEFLPTVSAFLNHRYSAMRDNFDIFSKKPWFASTVVGLNINIPIFSSGMRLAKAAQARIELQKAENLQKQVIDGLKLEYLQARSEFKTALAKKENVEKNVALAKQIYDKTFLKYKEGLSSSFELVQNHNQYLTAESNHTRAVVELLNAKTRLDKALSKL